MLVWPSFLYASYFIKCTPYFRRYMRAFQLGTLPSFYRFDSRSQIILIFLQQRKATYTINTGGFFIFKD